MEAIPCQKCKYARINAELVHVPEPDGVIEARHFFAKPRPEEFEDKPEVVGRKKGSGRKSPDSCCNGHLYAKHGTKRTDGGWRCRTCARAKMARKRTLDKERYRAKADKELIAYLARRAK